MFSPAGTWDGEPLLLVSMCRGLGPLGLPVPWRGAYLLRRRDWVLLVIWFPRAAFHPQQPEVHAVSLLCEAPAFQDQARPSSPFHAQVSATSSRKPSLIQG